MGKRATIADLARAAAVSVATVDRVLNGRLPVRQSTAERVAHAAEAIGFHAAGLVRQRVRPKAAVRRLGFLLQKPDQAFYRQFERELIAAVGQVSDAEIAAVVDFSSSPAVGRLVNELDRLAEKVDAVALVSPDHPALTAAVARLVERGIPVFSLLSDFAVGARTGYVGVDNRKVGRTAAWMIARCAPKPGKVALFVGSHGFHGHEQREMGLRSFFREHAPDFTVMETFVNHEAVDLTSRTMRGLLESEPDLVGCYVAGGGSEGAIEALRTAAPKTPPVLICNEDLPHTRQALTDGIAAMALATPLAPLSRQLVQRMTEVLAGEGRQAGGVGDPPLPFGIMLPESF